MGCGRKLLPYSCRGYAAGRNSDPARPLHPCRPLPEPFPLTPRLALAAALSLGGCASAPPLRADPAAAPFDPLRFFEGRTEGRGTLRILFRSPQPISVQSVGRREPDGSLSVRQTIIQGSKAPRVREWRIRPVSPGRYAGTLGDASGPVTAEISGAALRIRFPMKGGLQAEQWLALQPGGRSAANVLHVRKSGIVVARLDETIRKLD